MHIIAADVGGTKTRLAFADAAEPHNVLYEARYLSGEFDGFEPMLQTFIEDSASAGAMADASGADVLTLALPGLVDDFSARLTNLPWIIEKQVLKDLSNVLKSVTTVHGWAQVIAPSELASEIKKFGESAWIENRWLDSYDAREKI